MQCVEGVLHLTAQVGMVYSLTLFAFVQQVLRRRENNAFVNLFGFDRDTRDCPAGFFPCLRHCWLKQQ